MYLKKIVSDFFIIPWKVFDFDSLGCIGVLKIFSMGVHSRLLEKDFCLYMSQNCKC